MNYPSLVCGVCAVEDEAYFKQCCKKIIADREWTKEELKKLGFTCLDSSANFLFATHESKYAKDIFEALREYNIFVRYFNKPRIDNYLRITIGTGEQMERFVEVLKEILV